jgi:NAD(P)-dependent dehydrogenase (short-subunit alcohol dehydrogenase family)
MPGRLNDKVTIISGGANGMGAAQATLFAREGAKVTIMDVRADLAADVMKRIKAEGGTAQFVEGNVTSEDDWKRVIQKTVDAYGRLNILVNNAGIGARHYDFESVDDWRHVMDVNATSVFIGTKLSVKEMRKIGGGAIVNIASIASLSGDAVNNPVYGTSKGAVWNYTKQCAAFYAKDNIRVNSVHPGFMPRMLPRNADVKVDPPEVAFADKIAQIPLGRIGTVDEIAYGVLFMASDEASYITGTELIIDGGFLAL